MTEIAPGEKEGNGKQDGQPPSRLSDLAAAVGAGRTRGRAPVEAWHPPYCGDIDLRIAADGTWHYGGTPITRRPLVELFAGILRKDPERYVLVTPVECVGITVEDVTVRRRGDGARSRGGRGRRGCASSPTSATRSRPGPTRPCASKPSRTAGCAPYVLVRGGLWARLTRSLAIDLLDHHRRGGAGGQACARARPSSPSRQAAGPA